MFLTPAPSLKGERAKVKLGLSEREGKIKRKELQKQHSVLVVGRDQDVLDAITSMLEGSGYSVTGTLHDDIAIDLVSSSEFDALLLGGGMMQKEWTQIRGQVLKKLPKIKIVQAEGMESVLTLLKQALRRV